MAIADADGHLVYNKKNLETPYVQKLHGSCWEHVLMPWYKISMTSQEVIAGKPMRLQMEFTKIFIAKGSPVDAAMLSNRSGVENDYYFTPEAFKIASNLIQGYGAAECPDPLGPSLAVLVSNGSK